MRRLHQQQLTVRGKDEEAIDSSGVLSIDVVLSPHGLGDVLSSDTTAVVIDVLRATTTMVVALANGASGILPVATPEEAFRRHQEAPDISLIGGERDGRPLPGFHLGNSPSEYTRERVAEKQIILTTTNGTRALLACRRTQGIWIASFLNRRACCERLRDHPKLTLVRSGKEMRFCLEDAACAGAIIAQFEAWHVPLDCTDAARAARTLYGAWENKLEDLLHTCSHGRYLAQIGLKEDLAFCAQLDVSNVNGSLRDGLVCLDEKDRPFVRAAAAPP